MGIGQGMKGRVEVFEDFMGPMDDDGIAIADAVAQPYNDLLLIAVSGITTITSNVAKGGGVLDISGAGGAADGLAIITAPLVPADGHMFMECRFKYAAWADAQLFVGFQETVDRDETVMAFTLNGTTLTDNSVGNVWGLYFDTTATTDDFRAAAAQGGTILNASGSLGVRANAVLTADTFVVVRVELNAHGGGEAYLDDGSGTGMRLVDVLPNGSLSTTARYFPIAHLAAASTGDELMSVDYFAAGGGRSWTA